MPMILFSAGTILSPPMRISVSLSKRDCMVATCVAADVFGVGGQVLADVGHHELAVGGGGQADADGRHQDGPKHARARDSGREQRSHFVMALDPGDGEHHGDEREHAAGAVEERDAAIGVVRAHDLDQIAVLAGVVDEVVEVAEGIDHDVQPDETQQADDEHLDELAQHVAIDDRGHVEQGAGSREQGAWEINVGVKHGSIRKGRL